MNNHTLVQNLGTDLATKLPAYVMEAEENGSTYQQIVLKVGNDLFLSFDCNSKRWELGSNFMYKKETMERAWGEYVNSMRDGRILGVMDKCLPRPQEIKKDKDMINHTLVELLGRDRVTGLPVYLIQTELNLFKSWQLGLCLNEKKDRFLFFNPGLSGVSWQCGYHCNDNKEVVKKWWYCYLGENLPIPLKNVVDESQPKAETVAVKEETFIAEPVKGRVIRSSLSFRSACNPGDVMLETYICEGKIDYQIIETKDWDINVGSYLDPDKLRQLADELDNWSANKKSDDFYQPMGTSCTLHTSRISKQRISMGKLSFHLRQDITQKYLREAADQIQKALDAKESVEPTVTAELPKISIGEPPAKPKDTFIHDHLSKSCGTSQTNLAAKEVTAKPKNATTYSHLNSSGKIYLVTDIRDGKIVNQKITTAEWEFDAEDYFSPTRLRLIADTIDKWHAKEGLSPLEIDIHSDFAAQLIVTKTKQQISKAGITLKLPECISTRYLREAADQIQKAIDAKESVEPTVVAKDVDKDSKQDARKPWSVSIVTM